jgi:hypothetical protein
MPALGARRTAQVIQRSKHFESQHTGLLNTDTCERVYLRLITFDL